MPILKRQPDPSPGIEPLQFACLSDTRHPDGTTKHETATLKDAAYPAYPRRTKLTKIQAGAALIVKRSPMKWRGTEVRDDFHHELP